MNGADLLVPLRVFGEELFQRLHGLLPAGLDAAAVWIGKWHLARMGCAGAAIEMIVIECADFSVVRLRPAVTRHQGVIQAALGRVNLKNHYPQWAPRPVAMAC